MSAANDTLANAHVSAKMKASRLLGVDLFRVVAAFGVIIGHSLGGEQWSVGTTEFKLFCREFNVPFFLATSFFLLMPKLETHSYKSFFGPRWKRLIIPYLSWSVFYVLLRCGLYVVTGQRSKIHDLLGDPIGLLFFGQAERHLYFLPMLFYGEILALVLVQTLGKRCWNPAVVAILVLIGLGLTPLRNHDPNLASYPAIRRVPLELGNDLVRTAPYIALSMLLALPYFRERLTRTGTTAGIVFMAIGFAMAFVSWSDRTTTVPRTLYEVAVAFPLLLGSLALSPLIVPTKLLTNLTDCRFGIYLIHPFVIEGLEFVYKRSPLRGQVVTLPRFLAFIVVVFLIAWGLVSLTMRSRILGRYFYGVDPKKHHAKVAD